MWKESLSMNIFDAGNIVGIQAIGAISNEFSLLDVRKWTDTDAQTVLQIHTIFLMTSPHIKVDITLPCVICCV